MEQVSNIIVQKLETMVETADPNQILSKRKAIIALFPFAISLEKNGQQWMFNAVLRAIRASNSWKFLWCRIGLYMTVLFGESSPPSLDRAITLISPYIYWDDGLYGRITVTRWAAAIEAIPYTEPKLVRVWLMRYWKLWLLTSYGITFLLGCCSPCLGSWAS